MSLHLYSLLYLEIIGTHRELIESQGVYYQLVRAQEIEKVRREERSREEREQGICWKYNF